MPTSNALHDLNVTASNITSLAGDSVQFSASFPGNAIVYDWNWGDGSNSSSVMGQQNHTFAGPGIYLIYVTAQDTSSAWHDNLLSLLQFTVQNSFTGDSAGNEVQLGGSVVANTSGPSNASAITPPGGYIQFSNWIELPPTNPNWLAGTPQYVISAPSGVANLSAAIVSLTGLSAVTVGVATNASEGIYTLVFSVPAYDSMQPLVPAEWSDFTFTLFVMPGAGVSGRGPVGVSPHPGTVEVYQNLSDFSLWGSFGIQFGPVSTLDSALAENSNTYAIFQEVYQSLISYNGSQSGTSPGNFVPNLAMCVPGSEQCVQMFDSTLVSPEDYTFVLDPNATFYNVSTGAHWRVQANDVVFSLSKMCLETFAAGPSPGRDLCNDLLPSGYSGGVTQANSSWDGGLHYYLNNTPTNILDAVIANDTQFCTPKMMDGIHGNGCVTFNVTYGGINNGYSGVVPAFLSLVASPAIVVQSCSWLTSIGRGLPGWTNGTHCYRSPPGSPDNPNPVPADTAWDAEETNTSQRNTQFFDALGSGPYGLGQFQSTGNIYGGNAYQNYTLNANPYWGGTTCLGGPRSGCLPAATPTGGPPAYPSRVLVSLSPSSTLGVDALKAGTADMVDVPANQAPWLLSQVEKGSDDFAQSPTGIETFFVLNPNYSPSGAASFLGSTPTLPAWAFQDFDFRQFISAAFPHQGAQNLSCGEVGIEYCFQYGGIIPSFDTGYTPSNLTWPVGDPMGNASMAGSAAWWWTQTANDGLVGTKCAPATPCTFPVGVPANDTQAFAAATLWIGDMRSISGGAVDPTLIPVAGSCYTCSTGQGANQSVRQPFPVYWGDMTPDSMYPCFIMCNLWPISDWFSTAWWNFAFQNDTSSCLGTGGGLVVTQACQGTALQEGWGDMGNGTTALGFNMMDHVGANLSMYVPSGQLMSVTTTASWLDPTTIDLNPILTGWGVGAQPFYDLQYRSSIPQGYPLSGGTVTGARQVPQLRSGTDPEWEATPNVAKVNQTVPILVSVSGGTGIYHYDWSGLPSGPGCSSPNRPSFECTPTVSGTYSIFAIITDSKGVATRSPSFTLVVTGPVEVATFSASPNSVYLGQTSHLNVTVAGGISPLTYSYSGLPGGCATMDTPTLACTPSAVGSFTVQVLVTDSHGNAGIAHTALTVISPFLSSIAVSPPSVTLGVNSPTNFTASPTCTGGACPAGTIYSWSLGNTLGRLGSTVRQTVEFTAGNMSGSITVYVNATLNNVTKENTVAVTIVPTLGAVSITPSQSSANVGQPLTFTASASCNGGPCPLGTAYNWTLNNSLGSLSTAEGKNTTFTAGAKAGEVTITVEALLEGRTAWANETITINAKSPVAPPGNNTHHPSTFLGFPGYDGYILVGAFAAAGITGAVLLQWKKRRSSSSASKEEIREEKEPEKEEVGKEANATPQESVKSPEKTEGEDDRMRSTA